MALLASVLKCIANLLLVWVHTCVLLVLATLNCKFPRGQEVCFMLLVLAFYTISYLNAANTAGTMTTMAYPLIELPRQSESIQRESQ